MYMLACLFVLPGEVAGFVWGSAESRIWEVGAQLGLWIVKNKKYNKKSTKIIGRHQGMYQCAADPASSS